MERASMIILQQTEVKYLFMLAEISPITLSSFYKIWGWKELSENLEMLTAGTRHDTIMCIFPGQLLKKRVQSN